VPHVAGEVFFTGCRPSEAIALQWKYVGEQFITFRQAVTKGFLGEIMKDEPLYPLA
jgi:integrase